MRNTRHTWERRTVATMKHSFCLRYNYNYAEAFDVPLLLTLDKRLTPSKKASNTLYLVELMLVWRCSRFCIE